MDQALIAGLFVLAALNLAASVVNALQARRAAKAWEALVATLRAARRR